VAVALLDAEPAGVKKFERPRPSGCSCWRLAAEGRTFYTIPEMQYGAMASLGCIGTRVYTGLDEDEMYVVLRGKDLSID
jgi:hypothetical protein